MKGIIDIGSNSVRLYYGGKKTIITTRLAEGMTDVLVPYSMERTAEAIKELFRQVDGNCVAFATEAVRKAKNKDEFMRLMPHGLTLHVLSGDEEAEIGFIGATMGKSGNSIVVDLGGASCEIICGEKKIVYAHSFPFGCVNLTNEFKDDLQNIYNKASLLLSELPPLNAQNIIAVGGTATSLAAMAQNLAVYDPSKVDGYNVTLGKLDELIELVKVGATFPTLDDKRRKSIMQGGTALKAVFDKLGQSSFTVSESDNLEGYAIKYNLM